tara:strand:- start:15311 stop:15586 length:276 start_codon:yes stop_codon:yes gene_type:complete
LQVFGGHAPERTADPLFYFVVRRVYMLHMERALYPFSLGNVYGMKLHLGVLGEAFIAVMGITAQNCAPLFYTSANGICDIGLADPSQRSYA